MSFSLKRVLASHKGRVFEKWVFHAQSPLLSSAAIADIDKDGSLEVVFGTKNGDVFCVGANSQEIWKYHVGVDVKSGEELFYDVETLNTISAEPLLVDINNDGKKEVIFGSENGILTVLSCNGEFLWQFKCNGPIKSTPKVIDFNNDGSLELLVGADKLYLLSSKGDLITDFDVGSPIESTPCVLKGTGGKQSLIIFGANDGVIRAFDAQEMKHWEFATNGKITAEPIIFDDKIVVCSWDGRVYVLNLKGEELWRFKTDGSIYQKPTIADVNHDGVLEIIFGSCDNNVYVLTPEGERLWSYETGFWVVASPVVLDIDDDGRVEVIAGSYDENIYVFEGAGSYELDYVPGLSGVINQTGHYTDVLSSDPGERQGKSLWQYKVPGMVVGCSLLNEDQPAIVVNIASGDVGSIVHKT